MHNFFNGQSVKVDFFIPIITENDLIGVYSFSKDYTKLYRSGYQLIKSISIFSVITGFGIIVISLIISYSILKPLSKLQKYSSRMADGDFDVEINIKSKDEIGDLAAQFNRMRKQIKTQIQAILSAQEKLSHIENYRKQFFDNVTHELKTPLTIISGYAQMIENTNYSDRELLVKGIGYIQDESQRLQRLVQKLLDVSRHNLNTSGSAFEILCFRIYWNRFARKWI
ncbi:HAMP domain-containing protein [Acetivibrio clariflavus]|uniref:HAMP domain-containing protein n=1 Tax=Acetivibrio clariflavus TaxID=288965 RepID=UPI0031F529B1